ncbi:hypothetical protein [uncultured Fusobacterium sp.]|uniref:hypothetical protein n=1 Tax=uncultured Fusobacterium sp. TaxID=159267 RepID=UPI00262EC1D0|nr:hypothetical protein [uncultured Fusobacterium sp.]
MKYLGMCTMFFISTLNIFGGKDTSKNDEVVFIQCLTFEQQEEVVKMRTEFLECFSELKNKLVSIKIETQNEMRKENPDWNEIKKLNKEYSTIQNVLNKGMSDYKEKVQNIHVEIVN